MINVLGIAGSGKSTQGQLLANRLNCPWISMGQLLREKGDEEIQRQMMQGKIVDVAKSLEILDQDLKSKQADHKEVVVDGWPRAMEQAEWLVKKIKAGDVMATGVLHLKAHEEIAKQRLVKRGRKDDTAEAITQRFADYRKSILPILEYLSSQGIPVYEIDADKSVSEAEEQIDRVLNIL